MMKFHELKVTVTEQTYNKIYEMAKGDYKNISNVIDKIICDTTKTPTKNKILEMICERQKSKNMN